QENDFNDHNMFSSSELRQGIVSLAKRLTYDIKNFDEETYFLTGITQLYPRRTESGKSKSEIILTSQQELLNRFTTKEQEAVVTLAISNIKGTQQAINAKNRDFAKNTTVLNEHEIALHEKYVLAVACVILFFVGAPLGAIIRKG